MKKKRILAIEDVSVQRDGTRILSNLNWEVRAGEHWIVFGPNGAGKTTLLNALLGYLWPTDGSVSILGSTLGTIDVSELRRRIAVVSAWVQGMINENISGLEVLITGRRAHLNIFDPPSPEEVNVARGTSRAAGLDNLLEKPFGVMSTGERQRILIGRALATEPDIIILDEPCAGLDLAGREFVLHTIENISRMRNPPCLILTTHHVEEVTPCFTHALLLKDGEVMASGAMKDVFTSANLSKQFGLPVQLKRTGDRWSAVARL